MTKLNLSNDAADFLRTLNQNEAKPLWGRINQLLEGNDAELLMEFGDGKFFTTVNEFLIFLKADHETIYVDVIGRRLEASAPAETTGLPKQNVLATNLLNSSKLDPNIFMLFALSLISLFFCLTIERWFVFDLRVLAPFPLTPFLVCLAGAAIGIFYRSERLFKFAPAALLFTIIVALSVKHFGLTDSGFLSQAFPQYDAESAANPHPFVLSSLVLPATIAGLLAASFSFSACLGSGIGNLFARFQPLSAYGVILAASLFGYLLFQFSSIMCLAPDFQLAMLAIALATLIFANRALSPHIPLTAGLVLATILMMFLSLTNDDRRAGLHEYFSPYHKIVAEIPQTTKAPLKAVIDDTLEETVYPSDSAMGNYSRLPFAFNHPKSLLILDSGIGHDVQEAVQQRVESVDAVEIDPLLLKIGGRFNPAYHATSVRSHCQDPRLFVSNCRKKYDMIIATCQNFVSPIGIVSRSQSEYEHTLEYYRKCISLLNPEGIFFLSFAAPSYNGTDWLRDRFYLTAKEASGSSPLVIWQGSNRAGFAPYLFAVTQNMKLLSPRFDRSLADYSVLKMPTNVQAKVATDDSPFIYSRPAPFDVIYLALSIVIIATVTWLGRAFILSTANLRVKWQLFLLNAGLSSLVLGSLPRLITIYGNSCLSNAIIFSGILALAWFANYSIRRSGARQYELLLYIGLFFSLIVSYFLPVNWLAPLGLAGTLLITFFTIIPAFRVLLILPASYLEGQDPAPLLAFSLIGLSYGLLLKYAAFYLGQNSLLLLALILIGFSFLLCISGLRAYLPAPTKLSTKRIT